MIKPWKYIFIFLTVVLLSIFIAISQLPDNKLRIIACDVGQGDSILITYGSTQILTDGGPNNSVLDCLGRYMPFWDHELELVILSHPDSDHSTGLVSVFKYYKVDTLLINPIDSGTEVYRALVSEVGGRGIPVINPLSGMKLGLGLIYLDVLNPNAEVLDKLSVVSSEDKLSKYNISGATNLYSIAYKLSFKKFTALLLGDIPPEVSDELSTRSTSLRVDYIKIPHHGSVNGLTENLLKAVMPKIAVISVGKNSWGFPKPEILDNLSRYGVNVLRTDQSGDVKLETDGEKYWIK